MAPRPASWCQGRQYGVVIDAGSSASHIQVYSWVAPEIAKQQRKAEGKSTDVLSKVEKGVEEGEGWHLKVEPGISTLGDNPEGVAEYLRPLIEHAASVIPADQLPSTPIYLLATAGMRLLRPQQQQDVLSTARSYLRTYPLQLPDCADQIRIISGEEEGLYGWIAINYLEDGSDSTSKASSPCSTCSSSARQRRGGGNRGADRCLAAGRRGGGTTSSRFRSRTSGTRLSSGESAGSRTPPRGGRRKSSISVVAGSLFTPFRITALRATSFLRSWSRGRAGAAISRTTSAGSLLPLARTASEPDLYRPRPICSTKSAPFLRNATITATLPSTSSTTSSGGYWNDAPDLPSSVADRPSAAASSSTLPRTSSGSALALSILRPSSPPPMTVIPASPISRPTTPSTLTARRGLPPEFTRLTPRPRDFSSSSSSTSPSSSSFAALAAEEPHSTSSGVLSPSPSPIGYSGAALSSAVWDSLAQGDFSSARDDAASPTPGVGITPAGAKLRASKSQNNSQVNLAAGYFAGASAGAVGGSAAGGSGGGSSGGGSARSRAGQGALSIAVQPMASVSSTSLGGGGGVSPGAAD